MPLDLPRPHLRVLHERAARLLDARKPGTSGDAFARELLVGFFESCAYAGLDRLLDELAQAHAPLDLSDLDDRTALANHDGVRAAVAAQLDAIKLDGGSPRSQKPLQSVDALLAGLGVTLVDAPEHAIALDDAVRAEVVAALAQVVDAELALPAFRDAILAQARTRIDAHHLAAFDKLVGHLDDRALRLTRQPKLPLDAVQAAQRALYDTRVAVFDRVGRAALDRAQEVLARASAEAAARLDQPVTARLTPRDAAILRLNDPRVPKEPGHVVDSLLGSLTDLVRIAWRPAERPVRAYAASQTFAVGELIDHPKFGRGTVTACALKRIDVEFADGVHTLAHAPPRT